MADGIYSALSGAVAQQRSLDVVANNVANTGTSGFRADRVAFQESLARAGNTETTAPDDTRYVAISAIRADTSQGSLQQTGNPLDMALSGDGLFTVRTDNGIRYTRAGSFSTDSDGVLRTQAGHAVLGVPERPGAPPPEIVLPLDAAAIQVGTDGTIEADGNAVGRVFIAHFDDPQALQKEGLTLFTANGQPVEAESPEVLGGYLEGSNVNAVAGMNELITTSRSFEAFQKVIQGFRQIDERTARELGRGR